MATKQGRHQKKAEDLAFAKGLPANVDAERLVLGSIILDDRNWEKCAAILSRDAFSLEKHRRIWDRMASLNERGERIDRVTVVSELQDTGQLESVDGMAYILSLDEGLPEIPNIVSYCKIVKEKANLRTLIFDAQKVIDMALVGVAPAQEIATRHAEKLAPIQLGDHEDEDDGRSPEQIATDYPGGLSAFIDPSLRQKGLPTRYRKFDEMLGGGLQNGELVILAARPAMGKTALAMNICQNVAMNKKNPGRCDFFSLEMSGESLVTRMLCSTARVDQHKFRAGFLNRDERHALQTALDQIISSPLRIHDDFTKTLPGLLRRIRHAHKNGSRLIVLDYLQLMVTGGHTETRNLEVGEISRALKLEALRLQIPILALSQLSRATEKRGGDMKPQLSDLRDSGSLEQDADTVGFIWREEVYKKDREDVKGLAELIIAKQRNGPIGVVPLRFVHNWTTFTNRAEDMAFPEEEEAEAPPAQNYYEPKEQEVDGW